MAPSPYVMPAFGAENSTDFFGGYHPDEHQTLIVDDFYNNWKFTTWLRVCDRYPTEVHTKGGFLQFLARKLIFTSNRPPDEWYPNILADPRRADSFHRRVENIICFEQVDGVTVYSVKKGNLPIPAPDWMRPKTIHDALLHPPPQYNPNPDLNCPPVPRQVSFETHPVQRIDVSPYPLNAVVFQILDNDHQNVDS